MSDSFGFLRQIPLFEGLPDADLEQICRQTADVRLKAGEILFEEGSEGSEAFIIREGEIEIYKQAGGRAVQLSIRRAGEIIGEMSLLESSARGAAGRALSDSRLVSLRKQDFDRLLDSHPAIARMMLQTYIARLRSTQLLLSQSEKMAQLGTLTAGIAHELNNPASAVKRGAEQLSELLARYQRESARLYGLGLADAQMQVLQTLAQPGAPDLAQPASPLERSELEDAFEQWLEAQSIPDAWELAPQLVGLGLDAQSFARALSGFPAESLSTAARWIATSRALEQVRSEISLGTGRISEIVRALKTYVYLDQSPVQNVNVVDGLENTLVILRHKLNRGVEVARDYDRALPTIQAYGSELNQVWTNILDNAIDAMDGVGRITIRTRHQPPWVVVDIADNGPGIPAEIQAKLFSPFFTTKAVGKGTGLGLNISYNIIQKHRGEIKVTSKPGETHFEVWLPVDFEENLPRRENEPKS